MTAQMRSPSATGSEHCTGLLFAEAHADPVQAAALLITLRMKRESTKENAGILQASIDTIQPVNATVAEVPDYGPA